MTPRWRLLRDRRRGGGRVVGPVGVGHGAADDGRVRDRARASRGDDDRHGPVAPGASVPSSHVHGAGGVGAARLTRSRTSRRRGACRGYRRRGPDSRPSFVAIERVGERSAHGHGVGRVGHGERQVGRPACGRSRTRRGSGCRRRRRGCRRSSPSGSRARRRSPGPCRRACRTRRTVASLWSLATLTSSVVPACRSRTKASMQQLVGVGGSDEIGREGRERDEAAVRAQVGALALPVGLAARARSGSRARSCPPGGRGRRRRRSSRSAPGEVKLTASDWNATKRPSPVIAGALLPNPKPPHELCGCSSLETLTRSVVGVPPLKSRTNTSLAPSPSSATRLSALDEKATTGPPGADARRRDCRCCSARRRRRARR